MAYAFRAGHRMLIAADVAFSVNELCPVEEVTILEISKSGSFVKLQDARMVIRWRATDSIKIVEML